MTAVKPMILARFAWITHDKTFQTAYNADVPGDQPEFVAEIVDRFPVCYPLTDLRVIRHEPDNRFLECALAVSAEFIVTMNTAPGHFDSKQYQTTSVMRPGEIPESPGGWSVGEEADAT